MNTWKVTGSDSLPTLSDRFAHIVSAIDQIEECLQGLSPQQFAQDRVLPLVLERFLEIISVATDHIPADIKRTDATVDWKSLNAIGRRLERTSERVGGETLWDIAQHKLAALKAFATRHVAT